MCAGMYGSVCACASMPARQSVQDLVLERLVVQSGEKAPGVFSRSFTSISSPSSCELAVSSFYFSTFCRNVVDCC